MHNLERAVMILRSIHKSFPKDQQTVANLALVLTDMGTDAKLNGDLQRGKMFYKEAIELSPTYAPAFYNLGVAYAEEGRFPESESAYKTAIELKPDYVEALCNLGVIYKRLNKITDAIDMYEKALAINMNFAIAKNNYAIALTDLATQIKGEDPKKALKLYKKSLMYSPDYADTLYNTGVLYGELRKFQKALMFYHMTLHLNPRHAESYNNIGVIYKHWENLEMAHYFYEAALAINPHFVNTLNNIGVVLTLQGQSEKALEHLTHAIKIKPDYAEAYNNLGVLYRDLGEMQSCISCYEECRRLATTPEEHRLASQNRLLGLNYPYSYDPIWVSKEHLAWGKEFEASITPRSEWKGARDPDKKIKIGLVSADYFKHSVSYFATSILMHHDRDQFHITCYSNTPRCDDKTELMKTYADDWRDLVYKPVDAIVDMIVEDEIDILVDLSGHTNGNCLAVFASKAAPVQVTHIGYPNTTGLSRIDYRITDATVDPESSKQIYSEKLVRLPDCFLCYTPALEVGPVSQAPCERFGYVTFGSFNNLAKVTDKVIALWSRVLLAVPHSRLVLKCKPFNSASSRHRILSMFEANGVSTSRVALMSLIPETKDHMQAYSMLDISLDTFPYAGTTTTTESLYMGVPCITLKGGDNHAHNVGVSLMTAVGLPQFVAHSEAEYVDIAVREARSIPHLVKQRAGLREQFISSPMCDGPTYMQNLQKEWRSMWQTYCQDNKD
eukprot:TRINITY_DN9955_c0_g1_i2.p1 TRINITY_DN9955_c0_g1~~TRINITY_DN9955_c0_g1_i2.p1  ORF type:complete len:727 (-),score=179.58 TRINITY_DN9955_c0_g1_i2:156-2336(-)